MSQPAVTISVLCHNAFETTCRCIDYLTKHHSPIVQYVFTDNGSRDGTLDYLQDCALPNTSVVHHGKNLGFGVAHNYALSLADTEYFGVLNNDVFIKEQGWAEKLIAVASRPEIAIVGIDGTPCTLSANGDGVRGGRRDYVDGGLLVGRTSLFKKHGLFSEVYKMFGFEDSDLSLRYRQLGYQIAHVPVQHYHKRCATRKTIPIERRKAIAEHNRAVFLERWGGYLKTHTFDAEFRG